MEVLRLKVSGSVLADILTSTGQKAIDRSRAFPQYLGYLGLTEPLGKLKQ